MHCSSDIKLPQQYKKPTVFSFRVLDHPVRDNNLETGARESLLIPCYVRLAFSHHFSSYPSKAELEDQDF